MGVQPAAWAAKAVTRPIGPAPLKGQHAIEPRLTEGDSDFWSVEGGRAKRKKRDRGKTEMQ